MLCLMTNSVCVCEKERERACFQVLNKGAVVRVSIFSTTWFARAPVTECNPST